MAVEKDLFGFDELEKAFERMEKRYPNQADALLMAQGSQTNKRVKALSPVYTGKIPPKSKIKPGQLKKSWKLQKVKLYKGGTVRVVRIMSSAPHAHLIEYGHENVRGGSTRVRGKNLNRVQRAVRGITSHGRTEGKFILEKAITEAGKRFGRDAQKMLDKLIDSEGLGV